MNDPEVHKILRSLSFMQGGVLLSGLACVASILCMLAQPNLIYSGLGAGFALAGFIFYRLGFKRPELVVRAREIRFKQRLKERERLYKNLLREFKQDKNEQIIQLLLQIKTLEFVLAQKQDPHTEDPQNEEWLGLLESTLESLIEAVQKSRLGKKVSGVLASQIEQDCSMILEEVKKNLEVMGKYLICSKDKMEQVASLRQEMESNLEIARNVESRLKAIEREARE